MKKVLFATTALVFSAGFAAADVKISGYGRFGASYDSSADDSDKSASTSWIEQRMRLNIDASTTTDDGVEFGGRVRLQYNDGSAATNTAPALLYVSYAGLRVEVGNVNTALDSDPLVYNSEIGVTERSFGDPRSDFLAYNSSSYATAGQTGIYASYAIDAFTVQASFIDPDQYHDSTSASADGLVSEKSVAFSYAAGPITLSTSATWNGAGVESNNIWYAGAAYQFSDQFTAGLNYIDEGYDGVKSSDTDLGKTITAYGTYTINAISLTGYIANNDADFNKSDTAYGIGGSYNLGGGTKLLASIERGYGTESTDEETIAQLGVKFAF